MLKIREANPDDAATIVELIQELARYEREESSVKVTCNQLQEQMNAARPPFECLLAEVDGRVAGFALFFTSYSTWEGKPGLYLEDLYVRPEFRRMAVGFKLMTHLAELAVIRDYSRFEWSVLEWNQKAIDFYFQIGAKPIEGWDRFRMDRQSFISLAQEAEERNTLNQLVS